jgi:hypothetical protein
MIVNLKKIILDDLNNYLDGTLIFDLDFDIAEKIVFAEKMNDFELINFYKDFLKLKKNEKNNYNFDMGGIGITLDQSRSGDSKIF